MTEKNDHNSYNNYNNIINDMDITSYNLGGSPPNSDKSTSTNYAYNRDMFMVMTASTFVVAMAATFQAHPSRGPPDIATGI